MTEHSSHLKLTAYFGERARTGSRFVSDAALDLYGDARVATSILIRGIASFGPRYVERSDETLTMSEDPPVAVVAVDTADKITSLAGQVVAMMPRALVTLERAQLLTVAAPGKPAPAGIAKLSIYVGRRHRVAGRPAHHAVCDILHRHGFSGATVFLGVDGTAHGQRRRARFFSRNDDVPVMIVAVGDGSGIPRALPEVQEVLPRALITVERAQLCKRAGYLLERPAPLPETDAAGRPLWQKLTIHTSEAAQHGGQPIHRALVHELRRSGATSGATVLRGVWGFQDDGPPHGDKMFQLARQVPVTTIVVDTPARIAAGFEIVDRLTAHHGLVSAELVPAAMIIDGARRRGGIQLARHDY